MRSRGVCLDDILVPLLVLDSVKQLGETVDVLLDRGVVRLYRDDTGGIRWGQISEDHRLEPIREGLLR